MDNDSIKRRELVKTLRAEGLSLAAIGLRLGVSKERARQLLLPSQQQRQPRNCPTCGRPIPHQGAYCQATCRPSYPTPTGRPRGRPRLGEQVPRPPKVVRPQPGRRVRWERIAELARNAKTVSQIQRALGVSAKTIYAACRQAGISYPAATGRPHANRVARWQRIAELVRDGKTVPEVERIVGVGAETIRAACQEAGVLCLTPTGRLPRPQTGRAASRTKPSPRRRQRPGEANDKGGPIKPAEG